MADIARCTTLAEAVAVADGYLREGLTTRPKLKRYMAQLAGPRRPHAIRAVAMADPASGSVFESLTRVLISEAGLPAPRTQYNVRVPGGRWIARVDFAWPDQRLILECDGFEHHSTRSAFVRDRRRWSALIAAGWRVAVVTWHDVIDDPNYVTTLVAGHLAAAA